MVVGRIKRVQRRQGLKQRRQGLKTHPARRQPQFFITSLEGNWQLYTEEGEYESSLRVWNVCNFPIFVYFAFKGSTLIPYCD